MNKSNHTLPEGAKIIHQNGKSTIICTTKKKALVAIVKSSPGQLFASWLMNKHDANVSSSFENEFHEGSNNQSSQQPLGVISYEGIERPEDYSLKSSDVIKLTDPLRADDHEKEHVNSQWVQFEPKIND